MKRSILLLLSLTVLVSAIGCKSHLDPEPARPSAFEPVCPNSVFTGFGSPGPQQIKIIVLGCVERAGVYYVPEHSTLEDLMLKLGKTGNHEGYMPPFIHVGQRGIGKGRTKLIIHGPGRVKLKNVLLEDKMLLSFPEAIF
jgi:hypothetical protein